MSVLQEQAVQMINDLSDDNVSFLRVAGVSHEEVVKAVKMKDFKDLEEKII